MVDPFYFIAPLVIKRYFVCCFYLFTWPLLWPVVSLIEKENVRRPNCKTTDTRYEKLPAIKWNDELISNEKKLIIKQFV